MCSCPSDYFDTVLRCDTLLTTVHHLHHPPAPIPRTLLPPSIVPVGFNPRPRRFPLSLHLKKSTPLFTPLLPSSSFNRVGSNTPLFLTLRILVHHVYQGTFALRSPC